MATTTTNFNSSYFICLVAGSRSFDDYELLSQTLDNLLSNQSKVAIVSGGAKGADSLAERYAREHNLPLKVFPADWNRFGKSAGYKRNRQMHEFIAKFKNRGCVCFWDGKSKGTQHNFKLCDEFKNPLRIKRFKNKQERFNEIMEICPKDYPNESNSEAWRRFEHAYQDFTGRSYWG